MELQSKLVIAEQDLDTCRSRNQTIQKQFQEAKEENEVLKKERYGHFHPMDTIPL